MSETSEKYRTGPIFLTVFLDLIGFGIVMPFLALQAREAFGVSEWTGTLLGASYSLAQFLFVPFWGRLSDRIGRRPVLLLSVLLTCVSMLMLSGALAFASSISWLFAARLFGGMATANLGTASAYIADVTTPEDRVKGMGMIGMAFGLGFIIGPGLGGLLAGYTINGREGPLACLVAACLSLINLLWVYRSVRESLPPSKRQVGNSGQQRALMPLSVHRFRDLTSVPFRGRAVLVNFLIILAFSGLEMTYAFFAQDRFQLTSTGVGGLFVFMGVMAALVQGGFMRRAGQKFHDGHLAISGLILQVAAFALLVVSPQGGLILLCVASGLLAIGNGLTQPSLSGFVSRRSKLHEQGSMLSIHHSFSSLARVFGPTLGGALYSLGSPEAPFVVGALINLVALGFAWKLRGHVTKTY